VKISIVIQGGLYGEFTLKTAYEYAKIDDVKKVVISTWTTEPITDEDIKNDKICIVKSQKPQNPGPGNMNLQIISSRNGIEECDEGLIMKTRSDQHLYAASLQKWMTFFERDTAINPQRRKKYTDGTPQQSKIYLIGNNKNFPFHPQDHFFWGYKPDLQRLFSLPLWDDASWDWRTSDLKFSELLRCPIYLGTHYYRQFYPEVQKFMDSPEKYLLDGAPNYQEAMDYYTPIRDTIFGVFPRIQLRWEKYNSGYWYSYEKEGEYYAD